MSLTSPRPKRNCKSRSALELLSGADLPELDAPRVGSNAGSGSGGLDKDAGAQGAKSAKSKGDVATPRGRTGADSGRGGAKSKTPLKGVTTPQRGAREVAGARPAHEAAVAAAVAAATDTIVSSRAAVATAAASTAAPAAGVRSLVRGDENDVADAAYVLEHFVDPSMHSVLSSIEAADSLEKHVAGRRGAKQGLKCKYCGLSYQAKPDFITHLQSHSAANYSPWHCSLCSFTGVYRSSLAVHLNMHAERQQFCCELCGRGFATHDMLQEHGTFHDGSKTEFCFCCGHIFDDHNMLKYHVNADHADVLSELVGGPWANEKKADIIAQVTASIQCASEPVVTSAGEEEVNDNSSPAQLEASVVSQPAMSTAVDDHPSDDIGEDGNFDRQAGGDGATLSIVDGSACLMNGSSTALAASAEGGDDGLVVVDPHTCYVTEGGCDVQAGTVREEAVVRETEDERIAVMALGALETDGAALSAYDCAVTLAGPVGSNRSATLFTVATSGTGIAVCEALATDGTTAGAGMQASELSAASLMGQGKEMPTDREIVLQITQVGRDLKDFGGASLAPKSSTVLISLPMDTSASKSLVAAARRSQPPVALGSPKRIKRNADGISLLATVPSIVPSSAMVVDDGSASAIAVDIVDTSMADDGGNCSSSDGGGSRSVSATGKMEIDDVLLEYCSFDDESDKPGKKPTINCKFCEFPFRSQTSFTNHLRKAHSDLNIKPYKCALCDYRAALKGNLEQHIKFHAQDRPFPCPVCGKGFIQKYKLDLHLKFHENRREYKCDQCDSAFNDKQDLSRHNKNVHFPIDTAVKCDTCGKAFKNRRNLDMHLHVHTGAKEFKCEVCGKQYSTRESLRSHMKGHQYQFGCEICAKPLGSYSAFIAHKRLHDPNQKGYQCDECGKVLLFRATLEAHKLNVHSTERPFKCDQCPKAFKTKGQLTNHVISHRKDKPYTCEVCGYSVKRRDSLRLHMYRHASVKPYRCGRCNKEYTQKQALEIHLKAKHAGITTFNCPHCDKGFNTNYLLKKHLQKAHNIDVTAVSQPGVPASEQVIIAEENVEEVEAAAAVKKQTVLINAHICEHCTEMFASQHALALHILTDHMNQQKWLGGEGGVNAVTATSSAAVATSVPGEEGQVVSIDETIEIPIGEEMLIVQTVHADSMPSDASQHDGIDKSSDGVMMPDAPLQPVDKPLTG